MTVELAETTQLWADRAYDSGAITKELEEVVATYPLTARERRDMLVGAGELLTLLDRMSGHTLQQRWVSFEESVWPQWVRGEERTSRWNFAVRIFIVARLVRPGWELLARVRVTQWFEHMCPQDAFAAELAALRAEVAKVTWVDERAHLEAYGLGLRLLLANGYSRLSEITEGDLKALPRFVCHGLDVLDAALCGLGVFARTPQQGSTRHHRSERRPIRDHVEESDIPERFKEVTALYLETYSVRVSSVYSTLRHKLSALAHLWRFVNDNYPQVSDCSELSPAQTRAFVPHMIEQARAIRRGTGDEGDRLTAHAWLIDVRTFFSDICTWATEEGSPFAELAPAAVPLTRHDLRDVGFEAARRRSAARTQATVLDLEREMPKVRAYAARRWQEGQELLDGDPTDAKAEQAERAAFWDWALLELLVQSGLRIEEACELTTLDILKRKVADGRTYYLLHVKPSKFDRARVIPIGDGLGRVIAGIIRHVKSFYRSTAVPPCDLWDRHEKRALPRAPYLLQGAKHPSPIAVTTIRGRLRHLSINAEARRSDGSQLIVRPHDCRRLFASEHLNNNTPIHVIQALLGHATIDTVMVYAKLYPSQLVEAYRKSVRGSYANLYGKDALRNPTKEEWDAFAAGCSMRDMGTHLCALPTGEHCPRGLVCLGCVHAQPKKSAAPVFLGMLKSHTSALDRARDFNEPAGQIAARQLEVARIESDYAALRISLRTSPPPSKVPWRGTERCCITEQYNLIDHLSWPF